MIDRAPSHGTIAAARGGDQRAMAEIYRAWQPRLLAYFRAVEPHQAEDLCAEVWFEVARGLTRFRGDDEGFGGWLFTIARRRLIDARRRAAARPRLAEADMTTFHADGGTEQEASHRLDHGAAVRRLAQLPPDQAEVLLLRVVAGLDAETVAAALGKSAGAVRVLQHRALRRLAEQAAAQEVTR